MTDYSRGITTSVGMISGGTAANVIAQHCRISIDLRVRDGTDGRALEAAILGLKSVDQAVELARRLGDVADLDVVGVERRGGVEQLPAQSVRVGARRLSRRDEELPEELHLEVLEAGVVEDAFHLGERR